MSSLNYFPHCVPSNQTASCVESYVQQAFNLSRQTSQRRDSHTSLLPLPTRVDYFGPFYVTFRRTTEKRWGFLFTCLTTRAVHVEVVPSMDTSFCVIGVERFVSRRGTPAMIWSDNGTNFIGAEKELRECIEKSKTQHRHGTGT